MAEHPGAAQPRLQDRASLDDARRHDGIGLEALAFFDDNPAERELVRQQVPEVMVLETPADPEQYDLADLLTIGTSTRGET